MCRWDNAATTCYQAIGSAGSANASVLSAYDSGVVGLCTKFVDAGILSSAGVSISAGASSSGGVAVSIGLWSNLLPNLDTTSSFPCRQLRHNLVHQKVVGVRQELDQASQVPHRVPLKRAKPDT